MITIYASKIFWSLIPSFKSCFSSNNVIPIAASAPKCLKNPWSAEEDSNQGAAKQEEPWPALADRTLVTLVEQLFSHLLKVINICAHVMDDVAPGPAVKVCIKNKEKCDLYCCDTD